ncbi:hypothetical protein V5O48_017912, partial [Marasmius crinis-equi]
FSALEDLEQLVVQRLLALTKLNMSGVGYRQQEKIAQALHARAKAIQNALDKYNEAARAMDPPHPTLQWRSILDMATLGNFDPLKNTHLDLSNVGWAQPQHRECMKLYFGLECAREEIKRLNVEISCLLTSMIDDYADPFHAKARAEERGQHDLAAELHDELKGFSGTLVPGHQEGRDPAIIHSAPPAPWAVAVLGLTRADNSFNAKPTDKFSELLPTPNRDGPLPENVIQYFENMFTNEKSI